MNATRTRSALLLCPATLKKYHAEFMGDQKLYDQIKHMREKLATETRQGMLEKVLLVSYPRHHLKNNKCFKTLCRKLEFALRTKRIDEAINTLDYLLSLNRNKSSAPGRVVKDRLGKYFDWRILTDEDFKYEIAAHNVIADIPPLGLRKGDVLMGSAVLEPEPGELILFSTERGELGLARFHAWEWDEILTTDWEGKLSYFRPVTILVISSLERDGEQTCLLKRARHSDGDAV